MLCRSSDLPRGDAEESRLGLIYLIYRTSDYPAWNEPEWTHKPPTEKAFPYEYMHFNEHRDGTSTKTLGWAVKIDTIEELMELSMAVREPLKNYHGELVLTTLGGRAAIEIYDGYRE